MYIRFDQKVLLFKHGKFIKILKPGFFLNWKSYTLEYHSVFEELHTAGDPAELLADETFRNQTETVTVSAGHIALYFEDGLLKDVLTPGQHIFWNNSRVKTFQQIDLNNPEISADIDRNILTADVLKPYVISYGVEAYEKGLLYFDKQFIKIVEPGNYFFWKGVQSVNVMKADMRARQLEISGQEILTKDKVLLRLNFMCRYKINDPVTALVSNADYENQLYVCFQLALREYVGTLLFDELLQKKQEINTFVMETLKPYQAQFGDRLSTPRVFLISTVLIAAGFVVVTVTVLTGSYWWITIIGWGVTGIGMGFSYPRLSAEALSLCAETETGFIGSALQVSGSIGITTMLSVAGMIQLVGNALAVELRFGIIFGAISLMSIPLLLLWLPRASNRTPHNETYA